MKKKPHINVLILADEKHDINFHWPYLQFFFIKME